MTSLILFHSMINHAEIEHTNGLNLNILFILRTRLHIFPGDECASLAQFARTCFIALTTRNYYVSTILRGTHILFVVH